MLACFAMAMGTSKAQEVLFVKGGHCNSEYLSDFYGFFVFCTSFDDFDVKLPY